uniref:Zgc:152891 n=1 Tax=Neolamprologus brichardi TaxID=32507 RepID=A0A3Q4MYF1_NEOBR
MGGFEVTVHTSPGPTCGTFSHLWLSLIGSEGETPPIRVTDGNSHLLPGLVCPVRVQASSPLGRLILVRLRLEVQTRFPNLDWHCSRVEVCRLTKGQGSDSETQVFLCDRWLRPADGDVELRSGKLCLLEEETEEKLKQQRLRQLQRQQQLIRWRIFVDGAPQCVDDNVHVTNKGFLIPDSAIGLRFVKAHWMEDWYFGYQCLNGSNPLMLRQTRHLPPNLSVTSDMLRPFLPEGSSLEKELQKGNIYLLDYEVLDGLPANVINEKQTYLSAPLCLLHLNQQGQLLPIAIQLQQKPGPHNPVFLPSDSGYDWLLAKMWVHSADFQCHQLISHYLRTHMMAELCCVATLRQLPDAHPLHQLLLPHVKTSLKINFGARASLLASKGLFDQAVGSGLETLPLLLCRGSARISYRTLCVPEDLRDRGVDKLPQSFYAQDALRIWDTVHMFVTGWVDLYYHGDDAVQRDPELHGWLTDINTHGFSNGFPQRFHTRAEVATFVTALIYSCSALHAAVNFSQLDFAFWVPNCPVAMLRPPPQVKGAVTEDDIMSFLPDVNTTCRVLMALNGLSQPAIDFVPLCHYKEAIFRDGAHRRLLEEVQAQLRDISDAIAERNSQLELPYPYLSPERIENSVAI